MRSLLRSGVAAIALTGLASTAVSAACPDDIASFDQAFEQTVAATEGGEMLGPTEREQLESLRNAARHLQDTGKTEACDTVIAQARLMLDNAVAPQAVNAEVLLNKGLSNEAGEDLGTVEEVLFDPSTGTIAYLLVEHGGLLGVGEDVFAVPWGAVKYVSPEDDILVGFTEAKLENAPRFDSKDRTPLGQRKWALANHAYYEVPPYWNTRGLSAAVIARSLDGGMKGESAAEADKAAGVSQTAGSGARLSDIEAQLAALKDGLDAQSESIARLTETAGKDDKLNEQLSRLAIQIDSLQERIDGMGGGGDGTAIAPAEASSDATEAETGGQQRAQTGGQQAGGDAGSAATDATADAREERNLEETAGDATAKSGESVQDDDSGNGPATTQQAARPENADPQGDPSASGGAEPCGGEIGRLEQRIADLKAADTATTASLATAEMQLSSARERIGAESDCEARLQPVRDSLETAETESGNQSQ